MNMLNFHKTFPFFFLLFLINFSVQGQPPPPGYKKDELAIINPLQKQNLKVIASEKGPHTGESVSADNLTVSHLDKIYKTVVSIEDNLKISNTEKVKANANTLAILLNDDMEQSIDAALFDHIKMNAQLISGTNDLNDQLHYFSLISNSMHQLLRIK